MSTASPTSGMATFVTPRVGDGQNSKIYLVGGINIFPIMRAKSIQDRRHNYFRRSSSIAKKCTEVLQENNNISLDKSNSKITITSWIACIR